MVTSAKRLLALPDVLTTAELGIKDFNTTNWFGLAAPKGKPQAVIDKRQSEVQKALTSPELLKRFAKQGAEPGACRRPISRSLCARKPNTGMR